MKKINYFKVALLQVTFVATVLLITSCGFNQNQDDTKSVAEKQNEERFDDNKREKDAQFLVDASEFNIKQIQLGQLAQQRGNTTHVKELGKMMEDAHTKSQRDLTAFAQRKTITIPTSATSDTRDAYDDLSNKSGNDFDEAYADRIVSRHEDAIKRFENATTDSYDTEIRDWAIATLPDLRTHLNHAIDSQKKLDESKSK